MRILKWILLLLFGLCLFTFAVSNHETVEIVLFPFPYNVTLPLFLLILFSIIFGVILGGCSVLLYYFGSRRKVNEQAKRIKALENEVTDLKIQHK